MFHVVERLEQALCRWETLCFLGNVQGRAVSGLGGKTNYAIDGPLVHAHEFRKYLLGLRHEKKKEVIFDSERFFPSYEFQVAITGPFGSVSTFLASWTFHSRRVFHLTRELQVLLSATSLDGMKWSDIAWPFPAFAVTLEQPIMDHRGDKLDCIVVSQSFFRDNQRQQIISGDQPREGDEKALSFLLLSRQLCNLGKLSATLKKKLEDAVSKKQWRRVTSLIGLTPENGKEVKGSVFSFINTDLIANMMVTDSIRDLIIKTDQLVDPKTDLKTNPCQEWDEAARIVVGLCLYLQTLPVKSPHRSGWKPARDGMFKPDPLAITSEAEVCTVSSVYTPTREEREIFGLEGEERRHAQYEVRTHFRRGHWRRPPGLGNDPNASKVIWVRPTLVRQDRLPQNALPGGTEVALI